MAAMALQCVKDTGDHMHNPAELDSALSKIKSTILVSKRADGHLGNEFSTGLAVQVRTIFAPCCLSSLHFLCMRSQQV